MGPIGRPRYFHLLWEEDLEELRDVLELIRNRRSEVVARWYELYLLHFGDERTLAESEFREIFEPALLQNQDALLSADMDAYAAGALNVGRQLAECYVPLEELIAAAHLLEEAAQEVFPRDPPPSLSVFNKFNKLNHIRIILFLASYSRIQSASAAMRINARELAAQILPPDEPTCFHGLVGQSPAMRDLYRQIEATAHSGAPLLITGESGTGKETVARAVHRCGPGGPFVVLRCDALPGYLIDNELFGYERNERARTPQEVPTGDRPSGDGRIGTLKKGQTFMGLHAVAAGGIVLLKEISNLPAEVQDRLVRTLGTARRKGAPAGARIVATTSRDPQQALGLGRVSEDFIGLFDGRVLRVPALRERQSDVTVLARHFVDCVNARMVRESAVAGINGAALDLMERYAWPGNVRELSEAIGYAFACASSDIIRETDLPSAISGIDSHEKRLPTISFETFADAERAVLQRALEMTGGNKLRAAKLLKISRKKLYGGISKYGLKPSRS
jgi:DNA-binding NtrC family response regulator